jgi:hypothetical protein
MSGTTWNKRETISSKGNIRRGMVMACTASGGGGGQAGERANDGIMSDMDQYS